MKNLLSATVINGSIVVIVERICVLCMVALFVFGGTAPYGHASEATTTRWIGVSELAAALQEKNLVIVDLRTPHEFAQGHLPDAVNVPIEALAYQKSLLDAYKGRPLLLYCRTVNKTAWAIRIIKDRGFQSIFALRGGYEAFKVHNR
jgi:rhodanese-related sulfurtransferase